MKAKKHVKFELPHVIVNNNNNNNNNNNDNNNNNNNNTSSTVIRSRFHINNNDNNGNNNNNNNNNNTTTTTSSSSSLLLSDTNKKFDRNDPKFPTILRIPSLQRKIRNDIGTILNKSCNSSINKTKLLLSSLSSPPSSSSSSSTSPSSSSFLNNIRSKRFISTTPTTTTTTAFSPTTNKINGYLTRARISSVTFPSISGNRRAYITSRIPYTDKLSSTCQSTRISLQLTNWNPTYLRSKISPPIDINRKFCAIYPEECQNSQKPMRQSVIKTTDCNHLNGQNLNYKMEMLHSNIPQNKIFSINQHHSTFPNTGISCDNQLDWNGIIKMD
ncbi:hypothetical protein LOAG_13763 [Loa loa]|uniref:Uncharacterized protein n=2 Tax=Loa loa TaxID=7209 RepID=A0A1S0TJ03_LOALO|nr:hypothetical protein LOAG_13763 [Loa loa]EFO14753.2 hypothetical protein LOAG_13763 [Loa loa]